MNYKKIGVVGAGSWGTALAVLLGEHGIPIALWGHNAEHIAALKSDRENKAYLSGVKLADNIQPTASLSDVTDADVILMVAPSRATREVMEKLA
ncbi:MAG: 2-dehydropantoate 2-reductase N-terminal domain-containing protein, partial [Chthoniobacteraceae bacterium]